MPLRTLLIGFCMGAAEVVPGVSGGTIAFVTGVLERLINAIRKFTPMLVPTLFRDGLAATWRYVDANFLLLLFGGMGLAIVSLASGISFMLDNQPILIWAFFFGLVLSSVWVVRGQMDRFSWDIGVLLGSGIAVGWLITNLVPINLPPSPLYFFLGGAVAVCAWILPGLSGSFLLLVLGLYRFVIEAIKEFDVVLLGSLALGCALGIVAFAQVLSRLFRNYHNETLAVLMGFMLGSLGKIWPWRHTLSYQLKPDGSQVPLVQEPVLPDSYLALTGQDPQLLVAFLGLVVGVIAVFGLQLLAVKHK